MKRMLSIFAVVAALLQRLSAQVFDASAQFSATSNPNLVWRYGFKPTTLGSGFTLFNTAHPLITNAIDSWLSSSLGAYPQINHNKTTNSYSANDPQYGIEWGLDELGLHPGPAGQFSVLRFVAPTADTYHQYDYRLNRIRRQNLPCHSEPASKSLKMTSAHEIH